jgi:hypothetical protein
MINKDALVRAGAEKLADILLSLYNHLDLQQPMDILLAGLEDDPLKMSALIREEIARFDHATGFIDYRGIRALAQVLDQLRRMIVENLYAKSPELARDCLLEFLDLHETLFNRTDDNGIVGDVFQEACKDLGFICAALNIPDADMVELIYDKCIHDPFGIYNDILDACQIALTPQGLQLLQEKISKEA